MFNTFGRRLFVSSLAIVAAYTVAYGAITNITNKLAGWIEETLD